jgi:hypothetical protein
LFWELRSGRWLMADNYLCLLSLTLAGKRCWYGCILVDSAPPRAWMVWMA